MKRSRRWIFLSGFVAILFGVWVILEITSIVNLIQLNTYPILFPTAVKAISAVGSLLLTFLLALLYLEQTEIQRRQEKWMQADHAPKLEIESWGIDINELSFELMNLGNGVAKELAIVVDLRVGRIQKKTYLIEGIKGRTPLRREDVYARSLEPGQKDPVTCTCVPEIKLSSGDMSKDGSLSKILSILSELGCEHIECDVSIEYMYINSESNRISIWSGESNIGEDPSLEKLVDRAHSTFETDINIPPDNP